MRDVSAQEATRTVDCVVPLCPFEAENGSERCREHAVTKKRARTAPWTLEEIVAAIQRWAREHDGVPPSSTDWLQKGDYWPNMSTVVVRFGRWGAGLEAAGFAADFHRARQRRGPVGPIARPVLGEVAAERSGEAVPVATAPNARLRISARFSAMRAEIDRMERELLDALEAEAA